MSLYLESTKLDMYLLTNGYGSLLPKKTLYIYTQIQIKYHTFYHFNWTILHVNSYVQNSSISKN